MPDPPRTVLVLGATSDDPPPGLLPAPAGASYRFAQAPVREADLTDVEAILVWHGRGRDIEPSWSAAGRLRWIHASSAGVDSVLFPALAASDVVLTNAHGVFDRAMAEYALALMLHFAADLGTTVRDQRERRWEQRRYHPLAGRRAVVVGAGGIGRAVARLARAVGMETRLVARTARPDREFGRVEAIDDLATILPGASFVVLVLPATPETRGLFAAPQLAAMDRDAVLVNIGRGAILDQAALIDALRAGRLGGAALDVFATEPLAPDDPLWNVPGILISPHMAGDFAGFEGALMALFRAQLEAWLADRPLQNVVDKRRGYVPEAR